MSTNISAATRITSRIPNPGAINGVTTTRTYTLSYDANGNLTRKQNNADASEANIYTWDASNRLIQIAQSGSTGSSGTSLTASFSQDAFGRRIQSSITRAGQAASTVQYLYEGQQALGEIRDGKLSHRLLTGLSLDETIARVAINASGNKDAAQSRIYMTDALNSVIAQLGDDDSASLQNSYAYSPYGQTTTVGPDGTNNPIQYTSRENDSTGLYFYRARYYDTVFKVFISSDPIGLEGGMNMYGYVGGDPVSKSDPRGLDNPGKGPYGPHWLTPPCNGCGSGWNTSVVPDFYLDACNKHDQCYGTYGKTKWECDKRFWQDAFAESGPSPNVIGPTIYFAFPFIFGGKAYSAAQSRASGR